MPKRCEVGGCQNKGGKYVEGPRVYFYTLETIKKRNPQRFNDFLLALKRRDDSPLVGHKVICSVHFADDAFEPGELSRVGRSTSQNVRPPRAPKLKDDAWPTINMSARQLTVQQGKKRKSSSQTRAIDKTKKTDATKLTHDKSTSSNWTEAQPTTSTTSTSLPMAEEDTIDQDYFDALETTVASAPPDPNDLTYNPDEDVEETSDEDEYEDEDLMEDIECTVTSKTSFTMLFVYFSCLLELFNFCNQCGSPVKSKTVTRTGLCISVHTQCENSHKLIWHSMPKIFRKEIGNIIISAGIFLTGLTYSSFSKFAQTVGLAFVGKTTFNKLVKTHVYPVIKQEWYEQREKNIEKEKNSERIMLAGDGQHDSPGFCAKYCVYTIMSLTNDVIIDFLVVQRGMYTGDLEKNAFDVLFGRLLFEFEEKIYVFLSDRHMGIAKLMREKYPSVIHEFDIWHLAKSFSKKLTPLCAKFEFLNEWRQSIINHIWWSAATCKENSDLLVEKFKSILNHVRNIHSWDNGTLIDKCEHDKLPAATVKGRKWLGQKKRNYDSRPDYTALLKLVNDNRFINALKHTCHFLHTGLLESYHNIRLMYTPKRIHYPYNGMVIRSILAVLDHNYNVSRTFVGKFRTYSRSSKKYVLKNKYAEKSNVWRENLLSRIIDSVYHPEQFEVNPKINELLFPFPIPARITSIEKPTMDDLMSKQFSRFKTK